MEPYKVYFLEQSNRVVRILFLNADDDNAALTAACALRGVGKCEVWQGERRVATIQQCQRAAQSASLWL